MRIPKEGRNKVHELCKITILFVFVLISQSKGQSKGAIVTQANAAYEGGAYAQAAGLYDQALAKKTEATLLEKCAYSYYSCGNYSRAAERYAQLIKLKPKIDSKNYLYASDAALRNMNVTEALTYNEVYKKEKGTLPDSISVRSESVKLYTDSFSVLPASSLSGSKAKGCIQLDATASVDEGNPGLIFEWDFGDGTIEQGVTMEHCYKQPGTYTIQLHTIDKKSFLRREKDTSLQVVINPSYLSIHAKPVIKQFFPSVFEAGLTVPAQWIPVAYIWDFEEEGKAFGQKVTHKFKNVKAARVTLTVGFRHSETGNHFFKSGYMSVEVINEFDKSETLLEIEKQGGKRK